MVSMEQIVLVDPYISFPVNLTEGVEVQLSHVVADGMHDVTKEAKD